MAQLTVIRQANIQPVPELLAEHHCPSGGADHICLLAFTLGMAGHASVQAYAVYGQHTMYMFSRNGLTETQAADTLKVLATGRELES